MVFKEAFKMTKKILLLTILLLVSVPLTSKAEEPDGGQVYSRYCGSCHNFRSPGEKSVREWEMAIGHMRTIAGLTGEEASAVLKFLENKNPVEPSAQRAERDNSGGATLSGAELVAKDACRACHVIGDNGGKVGPSLNGVLERRSWEYVAAQIADPHSHNPSSAMPSHNFSQNEMQNLIKYLEENK
jgi:cytochrome c2